MGKEEKNGLMDKIVSLAKRRGFVYPGSDIYGGLANTWDFGPLGVELKNNIKRSWWKTFVHGREDIYGLDAAIIMNRRAWKASGHEKGFNDPLAECTKCHQRFRADEVKDACPTCGGKLMQAKQFNTMFRTHVGPVEDESGLTYLRPETAQGIFANFKNVVDTMAPRLPFGIAQIGKAFRNEITPGNFIFRTREFEQMEIEYFIAPDDDWEKHFDRWLKETNGWLAGIGIDKKKVHNRDISADELAHYSKRTVDIDFDFPFGTKELWGLAYRTDFDLKAHQKESGVDLEYYDHEAKKRFIPHVIEPSLGVERVALALLISSYREDKDRIYLDLKPAIASHKAAVFPLLSNKQELVGKARALYGDLRKADIGPIVWDDRGNIGKRYYAQDEIGTPFCFTIDFQTLEDDTVTVRDRNTTKQERIAVKEAGAFLGKHLA